MLEQAGFVDVVIGPAVDTFGGATGEAKARAFEVSGYPFSARRGGGPDPGGGHAAGGRRKRPRRGRRPKTTKET